MVLTLSLDFFFSEFSFLSSLSNVGFCRIPFSDPPPSEDLIHIAVLTLNFYNFCRFANIFASFVQPQGSSNSSLLYSQSAVRIEKKCSGIGGESPFFHFSPFSPLRIAFEKGIRFGLSSSHRSTDKNHICRLSFERCRTTYRTVQGSEESELAMQEFAKEECA